MDQKSCKASEVYCHGPLLKLVQTSEIFPDSKTFVDMPMKEDPETILNKYEDLVKSGKPDQKAIKGFVHRYFLNAGGELEDWIPTDWNESPKLLQKIINPSLRTFAAKLNDLWKVLGRRMKSMEHPERHSLITVPNPFIVPGDRFNETYYWDTYWIVGGLLAVDMAETVRGMLSNFLNLLDRYGFIPNGGRIYFLNRSQPPLLTAMMKLYHEYTGDDRFIRENLALLEREYDFWVTNRTVTVDKDLVPTLKAPCSISRYGSQASSPRPEGYLQDFKLIQNLSEKDAMTTMSHVVSACESGWDFSTRWFGSSQSLDSIRTRDIAPVDLNVYLCWTEQILAEFSGLTGATEKQKVYKSYADKRKEAIDELFWNDDLGAWFDLDLVTGKQNKNFFPSNLFPLLADCTKIDKERNCKKILDYLKSTKVMEYPVGIPSSLTSSGQQWDFPNAWSPLVHFLVESLSNLPGDEAGNITMEIARKWLLSNNEAFKTHGHMYEKYDVRKFGTPGGGGEYDVQVGFGWTNGVILMFLDKYGDRINIQ